MRQNADNIRSMALTSKQSKFVASYQIVHNSTQAAINAGYPSKSAPSIGCQLLKNPKIVAELDAWKTKRASEITKSDFIDIAMDRFKSLEVTEPNSPRFLDLAGKALGHIGAQNDARMVNSTTNVQININGTEAQPELWEMTRKLLSND